MRHLLFILIFIRIMASPAAAQVMEGELIVVVKDPSNRPVAGATVEIRARSPQFETKVETSQTGEAQLRRLPQGVYVIRIEKSGFEPLEERAEVRSAIPQTRDFQLRISSVASAVTVASQAPLLDPAQPSQIMQATREQLEQSLGTLLGRSTVDIVTTMPGWLLEANAVLHPRGSEYDTQYVIDGMPIYDNRSIAFAPAFENQEFEGVNVLTAGIPAEFGRRLGGVIALDTRRIGQLGHSSDVTLQAGSYANRAATVLHQYRDERTAAALGVNGGQTDRYLDPPSLENFTNRGSAAGFHARLDQDLTPQDRLSFYLRSNRTSFLVPNDLTQQEAGQRQDRRNSETAGQVHYQRTFSSNTMASVRGMVRDLSARLWSNPLSTPVYVDQNRGFREGAILGSVTIQGEGHTLKLGGDFRSSSIREHFHLAEPDELPESDLDFQDRQRLNEGSLFVQDLFRVGNFAANLGFRYDRYSLFVKENAFSPRVALSYYVPQADLQLRASYDRVFQPPPSENLLLSNAAQNLDIDEVTGNVDVPANRGNFFEVGVRKPVGSVLRLDVSHYWRTFRNYIDDDVFLNTGVSFPITFDTARIQGTEVRLEMPRWRRVSSYLSYSNMHGIASGPVTGGLFIRGGEAEELRDTVERFPISQDQRNTVAAQFRFEPHRRVWITTEARYGSGLPVELEDDDDDDDDDDDEEREQAIPQAILDKVDFERGRVRPNFSLNFSGGVRVWERDSRSATVQFDLRNATDRLNVVNFSGVFSGTALAPGRQFTAQLRFRF